MLPKYRRLVETLAQAGLLKVICGTDTLGVGINVPIRTVVFTALAKYDGKKTRLLQAREFHQIAGRAGRAGFDTAGRVVVQAPEHVIENERSYAKILAKTGGDEALARRRVVKKKPPEGTISWGKPTFERLVAAEPEPLTSSFTVTHAMVLNVIDRPGNAYQAMKHLLTDNHEDRAKQRKHIHRAIEIYRALLAGGVVERLDEPDEKGRYVRLTVDLQYDFALNQPLSPFALAAIALLDKEADSYAARRAVGHRVDARRPQADPVRAAVPRPRRGRRRDEGRGRRVRGAHGAARGRHLAQAARGAARGRLRDLPARPPLGRRLHGLTQVRRPRLFERAMTFPEYVQFYGLSRSEGIVLRYLADAYKALRQTVPDEAKTEELTDLIEWLGELIRQVDSSLVDEWEKLTNPDQDVRRAAGAAEDRDEQHARVPCPRAQRAVPPGHPRRAAALRRARRARRGRRLDRRRLGGGAR